MANRFCTQCGHPLGAAHRFCGNCGTVVERETVAAVSVPQPSVPQPSVPQPSVPQPVIAPPTYDTSSVTPCVPPSPQGEVPVAEEAPVAPPTGEVPPQYAYAGQTFVQTPTEPVPPAPTVYCRQCGQVLPVGATMCRFCGMRAGAGAGYCRHCGQQIHPHAVMCVHCGAPVQEVGRIGGKKRVAAGLFGIFLGLFGVHNFYLGYNGKAIAQLLITLLGWWTVIGPLSVFVWSLVEGIMILSGGIDKDAEGALLSD